MGYVQSLAVGYSKHFLVLPEINGSLESILLFLCKKNLIFSPHTVFNNFRPLEGSLSLAIITSIFNLHFPM